MRKKVHASSTTRETLTVWLDGEDLIVLRELARRMNATISGIARMSLHALATSAEFRELMVSTLWADFISGPERKKEIAASVRDLAEEKLFKKEEEKKPLAKPPRHERGQAQN